MDDNTKNAILIPVIVAALTTMVLQLLGGLWGNEALLGFSYAKLAMNVGIGLVLGGVVFAIMKFVVK
jgi:uncharacterized membrane protein